MARSMSKGRTVGRPAQGNNSGAKEDPKWSPAPQPAAVVVTQGSVSKPSSAARKARFKPQSAPGRVSNPGPAA
jgi:hypothetical protein